MNLPVKGVTRWRRTISQVQRLLVIGMLALLLMLGVAGSLLFAASSWVDRHAAGVSAPSHHLLAPGDPPVITR